MPDTDQSAVHLRPACHADGALVLWLEEACMRDSAVATFGAWRPSVTRDALDLTGNEMIELGNKPVGVLATKSQDAALHLTRLYIDPSYQNKGIGAYVLGCVLARAARLAVPIRLRVLRANRALQFYQRAGFVVETTLPQRRLLVWHPTSSPTQDQTL